MIYFDNGNGGIIDFPREVLKLYKLRKIISKAWIPLGITKDEAVDMLLWMIGEDVEHLHFSHWPERIKERTGLTFDSTKEPVFNILRKVAEEWRRRKKLVV